MIALTLDLFFIVLNVSSSSSVPVDLQGKASAEHTVTSLLPQLRCLSGRLNN